MLRQLSLFSPEKLVLKFLAHLYIPATNAIDLVISLKPDKLVKSPISAFFRL
ncbi:hypothetical protein MTBBW1_180003 [Desulfamplus magnetovallimortis]|uniref:Uncharacterized protein n=1 Tax=Desulfamplus magnetovallimortis TaxID=1246637 RepID=A0A1W1HAD2_9BACT|nr:hypothetical protein MTBBW1_180003 [Desulfamplus magnetovallimortis]